MCPGCMTVTAWLRWPTNNSSSFLVQYFIMRHCCNRPCRRRVLSLGRLNCCVCVYQSVFLGRSPLVQTPQSYDVQLVHQNSWELLQPLIWHWVCRCFLVAQKPRNHQGNESYWIPSQCNDQVRRSATTLNIFGEDRRPKGRDLSTNVLPHHWMPKRGWSSGWTGIMQ